MATLYTTDNKVQDITPANGKKCTLDELYRIIGCDTVQMVPCRSFINSFFCDENGKLKGLPINRAATRMANQWKALMPGDFFVGNIILVKNSEID